MYYSSLVARPCFLLLVVPLDEIAMELPHHVGIASQHLHSVCCSRSAGRPLEHSKAQAPELPPSLPPLLYQAAFVARVVHIHNQASRSTCPSSPALRQAPAPNALHSSHSVSNIFQALAGCLPWGLRSFGRCGLLDLLGLYSESRDWLLRAIEGCGKAGVEQNVDKCQRSTTHCGGDVRSLMEGNGWSPPHRICNVCRSIPLFKNRRLVPTSRHIHSKAKAVHPDVSPPDP